MDSLLFNPGLLFLGVATSLAGWWVYVYTNKAKWLTEGGSDKYVSNLAAVHLGRFVGLVAMMPAIVDPKPFGWTPDYLATIGFGDWFANVFAILTIVGFAKGWKSTTFWMWAFIIEGTMDTAYAGGSIIPSIDDMNKLNTMGWFILVAYVPGLIVTETALWLHLLTERSGLKASQLTRPLSEEMAY
jgi:hypothetical protein